MIFLDQKKVRECENGQVRLLKCEYPIESKTLRRKYDVIGWLFPSKDVGKIAIIKGKMTASRYVIIMPQNLKKSIRNLSVGRRYIFQRGGGSRDSSSDIDECSNSINFTTPKEKKAKIKSKAAKKDASQGDNNEQLDHTCEADVLCKECSENYYKSKRKCDWLRCIMRQ
ncbi:hypothetical protein AVEN_155392-1 [Araneus ventricosus]|uniref:Uncharacterized protein n=1 Tax=Araneus ventricosus TaxID=182803 RepID=A0A4Y2LH73_ARAVE|nr:hypothetical protein AVEN_155392-1 [Araneus ventricosus]